MGLGMRLYRTMVDGLGYEAIPNIPADCSNLACLADSEMFRVAMVDQNVPSPNPIDVNLCHNVKSFVWCLPIYSQV